MSTSNDTSNDTSGFIITDNERQHYTNFKHKAKFSSPEEERIYASSNEKQCTKCKDIKKLTEYQGNTSGSDPFNKDGYRLLRPECKDCGSKVSSGKSSAIKLAKQLGIPHKAPEGTTCGVCGKLAKNGDKLVFDHCHKTNKFRGYLHNSCNRSIGVLGDDVEQALKAVNYLNTTEKQIVIVDPISGKLTIQ
jgi:hypothetical protein